MSPKRNVIRVLLAIALLGMIAFALANRSVRVWYHRMCLHQDMSFSPTTRKKSDGPLSVTYWKWLILEGGRSRAEQMRRRQEIDAPRRIAALEQLGYYARREFVLRDAYDPLPDWLRKLSDKTMTSVIKGADWPEIEFRPSTSNTVLVHIIGPVPLVQEWATAVHDHEDHQ